MQKFVLHIVIVLFASSFVFAQKERAHIRSGNKSYDEKNYTKAENEYLDALSKNKNSLEATFNLGDALYKQKKYPEAIQQFDQLSKQTTDKDILAKTYHNLGNSYLQTKKYEESVKAYKQALRNNPKDNDTRYNLAYAQKMLLQQQQQQQNKNDKNQDDKKNNNDKKQDQQEDKNKKDQNKDGDNKDDKKEQDKQENKQPKDSKNDMKKEDAERILEALNKKEKDLKNKRKQKGTAVEINVEKDW